ncbi:hypothetical protein HQQ80_16715 [Microbacteriaceae bacterium VKM Ac-2855]|nr:hypothetical protein [Microbacteriaceae bacterium VKM Ac-2855]
MRPVVGWYVHHHGGGHLARMLAVRPHLDADVVCFSSLPAPEMLPADTEWIELPHDDAAEVGRDPEREDPEVGGLLHWAPLGHRGHRARLARIAAVASERSLAGMVVDVSVEVVLFARLLGLPVVLFTQPGARDDEPHRLAFRAASRIIAPWPAELLQPLHLVPLGARTVYTGGITRFEGREPHPPTSTVLLLSGGGGTSVTEQQLHDTRLATADVDWLVLGRGVWRSDPWPAIAGADVVVSWAGQNAVADIAAAGARAVVIPQERPFDEQRATAAALSRAGLAAVEPVWPEPDQWPALLARARAVQPQWQRWETAGAARRAADAIAEVVR